MASGVELATAWVRIVPSVDGIQGAMGKALAPAESEAGKSGKASGSKFSAALAGAVGGVVASLTSSAIQGIAGLVGEMTQAIDSGSKFKSTLSFAGVNTDKIDALTKSTQKYADTTVYGLADIRNVTAQLASNGVPNYEKLAEAAGNLNSIAGGTAETYKSVGMVLTQTAGQGKLTAENWNQLSDAIPGASGKLQEAMLKNGAYTGNFRDAMSKGMITSDEFNKALLELGSKPVAVAAAKSTTTFEGAIGNMQASIVSAGSYLLTALQPAFLAVAGAISSFAGGLKPTIDFLTQFPEVLIPLAGIIIAVLVPSIIAATTAAWAFTAALLANPVTWIVVGITALIAIIILLATHWDEVVKFITDVWNGFIGWITGVMDGFNSWWDGVWQGFIGFVTDVWNGFVSWIKSIWDGFINWIMAGLIAYGSFWISIWNSISDFVKSVWNGIVSGVSSIWSGFISWITGAINSFNSFWGSIWKGMAKTINSVFSGIGDFIGGVWDGIVSGIKSAVNSIIRVINGAIDGVNGIIGTAGDAFGIHLKIPRIPMLATGGTITRGGLTVVGEQGPELLNLPRGAQVNPDYDSIPDEGGFTFNNYAPLGSTPSQELETFANRREVFK